MQREIENVLFNIRDYFEISEFEISRVDYI